MRKWAMSNVEVLLKEYETLCNEIRLFQQAQRSVVYSSIGIGAAGGPVFLFSATIVGNGETISLLNSPALQWSLFLALTIISTALLFFLMIYTSYFSAISRLGYYVQHHLEPVISDVCEDSRLMCWSD